jgi:quinol monooxygenase YgiN
MNLNPSTIQLVGRIRIKPEHRNEFLTRTAELSQLTCSIENPPLYLCTEAIAERGSFLFYEIWPSQEALRSHFQSAHFKAWETWLHGKAVGDPEIRINLMSATTPP